METQLRDLKSRDELVRAAALQELRQRGKAILPELLAAFRAKQLEVWTCAELIVGMDEATRSEVFRTEHELAAAMIPKLASQLPIGDAIAFLVREMRSGHSRRISAAVTALTGLHEKATAAPGDSLQGFQDAVPDLLELIKHPDKSVRSAVIHCLAFVQPPGGAAAIATALEREHDAGVASLYGIADAIARYGAGAAPATPALLRVLQASEDQHTVSSCCKALAAIGSAPPEATAIMEAARERLSARSRNKSDEKAFRSAVNRSIKTLQRAGKPAKSAAAAPSNERQDYLFALFERLAKPEDGMGNSLDSTAAKAMEEARLLADPALIDEIATLLQRKLKVAHLQNAVLVLGFLTQNTGSERGKQLILEVLERPKLPPLVLQSAVFAATDGKVLAAIPFMRRLLEAGDTSALEFIDKLGLSECVEDVAAFMAREREKKTEASVSLGLFTLVHLGTPNVVPHLLEYAKRQYTSRRHEEGEWRFLAITALGTVGDASVVDELIQLLERSPGSAFPIVLALCRRGDHRAYEPVLGALRRLVHDEGPRRRESWSQGYRTLIINALDLFQKLDRHREPEVAALLARLREPDFWKVLEQEEREFLLRYEIQD